MKPFSALALVISASEHILFELPPLPPAQCYQGMVNEIFLKKCIRTIEACSLEQSSACLYMPKP